MCVQLIEILRNNIGNEGRVLHVRLSDQGAVFCHAC